MASNSGRQEPALWSPGQGTLQAWVATDTLHERSRYYKQVLILPRAGFRAFQSVRDIC